MFKTFGLLGIVAFCGMAGIIKTRDLKRRVILLEDFLQMIIEVKGQINYFREPLPDIFGKLQKNGDSKAFSILDGLRCQINERGGDMVRIWPQKIEELYGDEPLKEDDMEILRYPGEFMGQTDFDNHIYHFSYLEERLRKQIDDAREDLRRKGPMYGKIGFFLGAIIAIILI